MKPILLVSTVVWALLAGGLIVWHYMGGEALAEVSVLALAPDKDNYTPEEVAEFTVNISSSKVAEGTIVRFWGIKSVFGDYFYKDESRPENLGAGTNEVKFTLMMPSCTSCFINDYGSGPYSIHAGVYVQNEMVDNATLTMTYDNTLDVFVIGK